MLVKKLDGFDVNTRRSRIKMHVIIHADRTCLTHSNCTISAQKFALRVCLKQWNMPYCDMLEHTGLPRLESRRSLLNLSLTFKVNHGLIYFPNDIYSLSITRSSPHISHSLSLRPYSSSSQFFYSCIPHSISLWNALPFDPSSYNVVQYYVLTLNCNSKVLCSNHCILPFPTLPHLFFFVYLSWMYSH